MRLVFGILFLLNILLVSSFALPHDYFVSNTTITYKKEGKVLEITIKLTAHDIEKALSNKGNLQLGSEKELANADEILFDYVRNHFLIWLNGGSSKLEYVGKEVELDESLYIHIQCKTPRIVKNIKIENNLLYSIFPLQENIVHFNDGKMNKNYTFNSRNNIKEIILN